MKAAVFQEPSRITIQEREKPSPTYGTAIVEVKSSAVCGSDLVAFQGEEGWIPEVVTSGVVMGHEFTGIIRETGEGTQEVEKDSRVWVDPLVTCGHCAMCKQGKVSLCKNGRSFGHSYKDHTGDYKPYPYGGFEKYVQVPKENLFPLPENISFSRGTLIEPLSNAVHLMNKAEPKLGDSIAIFGAGALGLSIVGVAQVMGCHPIFVFDPIDSRCNIAKKMGADYCINPENVDLVDKINDKAAYQGVDITAEAVVIETTYQQAIHITKKDGKILALGNSAKSVSMLLHRGIVSKELHVLGTTGWNRWEPDISIQLISTGQIDFDDVKIKEFALSEIQKAFEELQQREPGFIRAIIRP